MATKRTAAQRRLDKKPKDQIPVTVHLKAKTAEGLRLRAKQEERTVSSTADRLLRRALSLGPEPVESTPIDADISETSS